MSPPDDGQSLAPPPSSTATSTSTAQASRFLPIRIVSKVSKGFGRGSTDLGIPTANVSRDDDTVVSVRGVAASEEAGGDSSAEEGFDRLPTGIYWGFARIVVDGDGEKGTAGAGPTATTTRPPRAVHKAAISIGYNPTYGNDVKTVEPHLIAPPDHDRRHASRCGETQYGDFYDRTIRLSVVGYLRPEAPFEGLEKLTDAIKRDIAVAERLCDGTDEVTLEERSWTSSSSPLLSK